MNDAQRRVVARQSHVTWSAGILTGYAHETGAFKLYGLEPGDWLIGALRGVYAAELTIQEDDRAAFVQLRDTEE